MSNTVQRSTIVVSKMVVTPAFVSSVINAMSDDASSVVDAKNAFDAAKGRALPLLTLALKDCEAVTEDAWSTLWAEPAMATYLESGRYKVDAKGVSLSARSAVSGLKVCVIALTNGVQPGAGDSLYSFTSEARKECAARGLIKATTSGRKADAPEVKEAKQASKPTPQAPKGSSALPMDAMAYASGLVVSTTGEEDANLARLLCNVLGDADAVMAFEDWCAARAERLTRRRAA